MVFPRKYFSDISNTEALSEISRKGGSVKSSRKRYASKIREMMKKAKNGKIKQSDVDWFMERLENSDANIIELKNWLDGIRTMESAQSPQIQNQLINTAIQLHKAHFGDKKINQNLNINIDIENMRGELETHIKDILEDDE